MEKPLLSKESYHRYRNELQLQRRTGIKVRLAFDNPQWWTEALIAYTESIATAKQISAARSYVKAGKVLEMRVNPGVVEAKVQGRRKAPYLVRLYSPLPEAERIEAIMHDLREKAIYGALLLSGEMPTAVRDVFLRNGVALMPDDYEKKQLLCSCPEPESICKHILAVLYVIIGAFDRDPFLLLRMRGLKKEELLAGLTKRRMPSRRELACSACGETHGGAAHPMAEQRLFFCAPLVRRIARVPMSTRFYGEKDLMHTLEASRKTERDGRMESGAQSPLFDFPLWRGETSFKDSMHPYYDTVRKYLKGR